jgi:adenine-specific DNA-methyltransferase
MLPVRARAGGGFRVAPPEKKSYQSVMTTKDYDSWDKNRLIDEIKRLSARKKYGLVWEEKPEEVVERCKTELPVLEEVEDRAIEADQNLPTNFIIEGDNFHALSVLNYTHAGKFDVIYIDPPYNTGAKNWKYNNDYVDKDDEYRHSKWLSFMRKRLVSAKSLLKPDGVLVCAIDKHEHAHLCVLLEEIFSNHDQHSVTIVHNPKGVQGTNFSYTHEYAIFVLPINKKAIEDRVLTEDEIYVSNLRNWGNESERSDAKNCFYPIIVKNGEIAGFGDVAKDDYHPESANEVRKDGAVLVWPIDERGIERKWRYARQSVEDISHVLRIKTSRNGKVQIMIAKDYGTYKTVWQDKRYDASEYGTKLLREIIPDCDFDFPKSLYTVQDCLSAVIKNNHRATILDFFAGSGTTGHAVMALNKEDGGNRQFILCTNNENNIAEEVTYPRIKNVINGYADVEGIPANIRYFKTAFVPKSDVSDDTRKALITKSTEMLCVKESTFKKSFDNKKFKIYRNAERAAAILFDLDALYEFKERIENVGLPTNIYVFSLTSDNFAEDFTDLGVKHRIRPIPEGILEVYRKIFA